MLDESRDGPAGAAGATEPGYPPPGHVLGLLGLRIEPVDGGLEARLAPAAHLCHRSGAIQTGLLATAIDVAGGMLSARAVQPDWIATATLAVDHHRREPATGEVVIRARVLRAGRTLVVLGHEVHDGAGLLADGTMTFTRLPRRDGNPVVADDGDGEGGPRRPLVFAATTPSGAVADHIGLEHRADGTVALPITDVVRNSLGSMQGGMLGLCADLAAERAGSDALGTPARTVDLAIDYVRVARTGPVVATAEVVRAGAGTARCRVHLADAGDRHLVASAAATVEVA